MLHDATGKPAGLGVKFSSKSETTHLFGGKAIKERVGHSFIRATMRERDVLFAGELSGHFYFKDNFTCDSGAIALMTALSVVAAAEKAGRPFSELVADLRRRGVAVETVACVVYGP